jgi:hypothetical protein
MKTLTQNDFTNLFDVAMKWGGHWKKQAARFEPGVSFNAWKWAYWFEMNYAAFLLAQDFLTTNQIAFTTTADEAGGWVILTNYNFETGSNK